jgi:hypothetical protein
MCFFRKTFDLPREPTRAEVLITVDNDYDLYVNGTFVGGDGQALRPPPAATPS